jgi:DHA1 family inner membrane transport protein
VKLIVFSLACGGFAIGTGEFSIMGLLPQVARGFEVSIPDAGHVITAYAVGVTIGAPMTAIFGAKVSYRKLLLILLSLFALCNLASAAAPDLRSMVALRLLSGLPHGAYFGLAALAVAAVVPFDKRTQTIGHVMLGLTVATLLGTPLMAIFGELLNWRVLFVTVGLVATMTVILVWLYLPADSRREDVDVLRELTAFTHPQVLLTLAIAASGFAGMFSIFSYIAATAMEYAKMPAGAVALLMVLFGFGMNAGTLIGSRMADKSLMGTIGAMLAFNIASMTAFGFIADSPPLLCISTTLVGCTFALVPALQSRLMDVAREGQTLAAASLHSAFNIANALGAWLGGRVLDLGFGYPATGYVGAALSAVGLVIFAVSWRLDRH